MFTGLIESVGKISKIMDKSSKEGKGLFFSIQSNFKSVFIRESIAVDGVCLTVLKKQKKKQGALFSVDIGEETLRKTTMGQMKEGGEVNLERSIRLTSELGGHFVQGHVDATGQIIKVKPEGNSKLYTFSYPSTLEPFIVPKGSVAIDGISLTVVDVKNGRLTVSILPFTEDVTSLRRKSAGSAVNIETDILAKIVVKQMQVFGRPFDGPGELFQKKNLDWSELR